MSMNISGSMVPPISTGLDPMSIGGGIDDTSGSGGFGDVLKNAISQVSTLQGGAEQQVNNLMQGGNADMSKVMISVEKADVAFQLMMQVRNKIVSAYQDIEKMQF
jgi:flagellar hook-basal body complex protein FliE